MSDTNNTKRGMTDAEVVEAVFATLNLEHGVHVEIDKRFKSDGKPIVRRLLVLAGKEGYEINEVVGETIIISVLSALREGVYKTAEEYKETDYDAWVNSMKEAHGFDKLILELVAENVDFLNWLEEE